MKRGIKEMNIILASGSPRRKELLAQAGFDFEVEVSNADENVAEESPTEMVEELAARKAEVGVAIIVIFFKLLAGSKKDKIDFSKGQSV